MTKYIHIIVGLEVGGAELMLKRLVRECSLVADCQQTVISLTGKSTLRDEILDEKMSVDVISLNMKSIFSFPLVVYKLIGVLKSRKPDAVFTWMYHSDLIGGVAAYLCGIRNIFWGIRNTEVPQNAISTTAFIIKVCSVLSYFIPKKIICCADAAIQTHINLGYCSEKMINIPNGYDLTLLKPSKGLKNRVKEDLGLSQNTKIVGIVGRFDELKDFPNFVQAAALVSSSIPQVCFFMVGKGLDEYNVELVSWITELALDEKVILFGEREPHDLYAAMDCFCLSSKAEGFPNVVAEAMAMETPCVVTDVGDAASIVNGLGRVVPPRDPKQLAKALIDILTIPDKDLNKIGVAARMSIKKRYDIKMVAKEYMYLATFDQKVRR